MKINVLSLFDGMSCAQIALERIGISVENYFASEIDKYAIKVTQHNYPKTIQLGTVQAIKGNTLPKITLLCGGSPCQSFSNATSKPQGFAGKSGLFWEFVRLLEETKPTYFLFENVKMKKEWQAVITKALGVEPIEINSNLVSAQNRRRLYWFGQNNEKTHGVQQVNLLPIPINPIKLSAVLENFTFDRVPIVTAYNCNLPVNYKNTKYKTLVANGGSKTRGIGICDDNGLWRKLTPIECERLQTVPENYSSVVSAAQRYKMLGNGWTVAVIAHIFKSLLKAELHAC